MTFFNTALPYVSVLLPSLCYQIEKTHHLLYFLSLSLFIDIFKGFGSHLRFRAPLFEYSYSRAITHQDHGSTSLVTSASQCDHYCYPINYSDVSNASLEVTNYDVFSPFTHLHVAPYMFELLSTMGHTCNGC